MFDDFNVCDDCEVSPATVRLTHVEHNETHTFHLCEDCARGRGVPIPDGDTLIKGLEAMVGNAAAAALGGGHVKVTVKPAKEVVEKEAKEEPDTVCSNCAMKLSEFRSAGWLGCAECYDSFEEQIGKILMQIHGADGHRGKSYRETETAVGKDTRKYVERLRRDLNRAIVDERFEHAAALRDCIRGLGERTAVK